MKLIIGKFYIIVFDVRGKALTFHCKIEDIDGDFITFTDKFNKQYHFLRGD